jgi:hypothetical protein
MGLLIYVYRQAGSRYDCTNGGLSSRVDRFTVTNVAGPFKPCADAPAISLMRGNVPGTVKLVPEANLGAHSMFGGNYAATSDSRFREAVEKLTGGTFYGAVPIHDRVE